jgi:hypothetical protein
MTDIRNYSPRLPIAGTHEKICPACGIYFKAKQPNTIYCYEDRCIRTRNAARMREIKRADRDKLSNSIRP